MSNLARIDSTSKAREISNISEVSGKVDHAEWIQTYTNRNQLECLVTDDRKVLYAPSALRSLDRVRQLATVAGQRSNDNKPYELQPITKTLYSMLVLEHSRGASDERGLAAIDEDDDQDTSVQTLLKFLIDDAFSRNASDIHIQTDIDAQSASLYYRIDGKLETVSLRQNIFTIQSALDLGRNVIDWAAKSNGGSSPEQFNEREPRDASFTETVRGVILKMRYTHTPTDSPKGLRIVIRLRSDDSSVQTASFSKLGYSTSQDKILRDGFSFSHGLILFTGPTGSGKSTLLAAGVATFPEGETTYSFEDPVESKMANCVQIQVNPKHERLNWTSFAKSTLRLDPDNIIYGEMREKSVVLEGIQQAATGHLVLSTLHANSATGAVQRLVDMGIDWKRLADPGLLRMIVAQRLVRIVCSSCAPFLKDVETSPDSETARLKKYFSEKYPKHYPKIRTQPMHPTDCPHCGGTGEMGRRQICEIVMVDHKGREFIRDGDILGWEEYLINIGWCPMDQDALHKVLRGDFCPLTVQAVLDTPFGMDRMSYTYPDDAFARSLKIASSTSISLRDCHELSEIETEAV